MAIRLNPKVRRFLLDKCRQKRYGFLFLGCIFAILYCMGTWPFFAKDIVHDPNNLPYSLQDYSTDKDEPFFRGCTDTRLYLQNPAYSKMNASFVMLTRNEEIEDVLKTMRSIEGRFNKWFKYPYVFLNDDPFTDHFKDQIQAATNASVEFGTVDEIMWEFPAKVRNSLQFKASLEDQNDRGIMYGNMESYHKMCRFYSGIFYKHPLVSKYEWYWRIEPDVDFFCDISYDPFFEMAKHNKKYGFTVLITELYWTVPNLFRTTKSFIKKTAGLKENLGTLWKLFTFNYNILDTDDQEISRWVNFPWDAKPKLTEKLMVDFLLENHGQVNNEEDLEGIQYLVERARSKVPMLEDSLEGEDYNLCHFWSNFEIARVDLFDNEIYNAYFKFLEESGGFWTERWGDAPIHSIGLGMTLDLEDVHYFRDIGYRHSSLQHCPKNALQSQENLNTFDGGYNFGCGCRCVCPKKGEDIEDHSTPCMDIFFELLHGREYEKEFPGCYKPSIKDKDVIEEIRRENFRVIE
ncbi:CFF_collapsed_G0027120.mRNA.1.CDS.1 [Saccharomyces cerevisiae]|nr:CFF_collapsed_G0027120.mRNA.1.CDS.1 [Saccharomyces cerevisiae]